MNRLLQINELNFWQRFRSTFSTNGSIGSAAENRFVVFFKLLHFTVLKFPFFHIFSISLLKLSGFLSFFFFFFFFAETFFTYFNYLLLFTDAFFIPMIFKSLSENPNISIILVLANFIGDSIGVFIWFHLFLFLGRTVIFYWNCGLGHYVMRLWVLFNPCFFWLPLTQFQQGELASVA